MEKTSAYALILLSAIVVYGFTSSYTGQIARSGGNYYSEYGGESGTFQVYAKIPGEPSPARQIQVYAPTVTRPQSYQIGNNTNHTTCLNNACVVVSGPGTNQCWPPGSLCGNLCGNGVINPGEQCDPPGNTFQCLGGGLCLSNCQCGSPPTNKTRLNPGCYDTDTATYPTINYFVKGTVTIRLSTGATFSSTDSCNNTVTLNEKYCVSPYTQAITGILTNCTQFNMACSNGRCV